MAVEDVRAFLEAVDNELFRFAAEGETVVLNLIGRSALILGYGLRLMTKDVDVVEVAGSRLQEIAFEVFKKGGAWHQAHGFYLEAVSSGLPPLPNGFERRCADVPGPWRVIRPRRIEAHDLIITKLRRFHLGDREDIRILCDTGEVEAGTLRERFDAANLFSDPDEPKVTRSRENLEAVVDYLEGQRRTL